MQEREECQVCPDFVEGPGCCGKPVVQARLAGLVKVVSNRMNARPIWVPYFQIITPPPIMMPEEMIVVVTDDYGIAGKLLKAVNRDNN